MVKHNPSTFSKLIYPVIPGTPAAGTYTFGDGDLIDTQGWTSAHVIFMAGTGDRANTIQIQESDTNVSADATDISGATISHAATDDNKAFQLEVDLHGKGRYLNIDWTVGAGTAGTPSALCVILTGPDDSTLANQTFPTASGAAISLQGSGLV